MVPEQIGRYVICRELVRGGMAIVYLADDPNMKRQVAIKVLPRELTFDETFRTRFRREAEVIGSLEHAHIVPLYDFGEHEGQPFIVMRYMPGGSLADRIQEGPFSLTEAATILEPIGAALDQAHQEKIIHRDVSE